MNRAPRFTRWLGAGGRPRGGARPRRMEGGLSTTDFEQALSALVGILPAETASFATRAERVSDEFSSTPIYEGIGAFVSIRSETPPRILLLSVMQGSPAEAAGLGAPGAGV